MNKEKSNYEGRKKGIEVGDKVLTTQDFMEALIRGHRQLKLKGYQDVNTITGMAVLEINGSSKIQELYMVVDGFRGSERKELELGREFGNEWEAMGGFKN